MPPRIVAKTPLTADQLGTVRDLIAHIARQDGRDPLSDQALTRLGVPTVQHVLALDGAQVTGYAQLDGRSLEIAAEPGAIGPLLDAFADRSVLVWSHGEHSRVAPALAERSFRRARELHQLRRSLADPIDVPPAPDGMSIRPFVIGQDEDAQLRVNAAAFSSHPDQGGWTRRDLEAREHEPWFDPSGFLLAWHGAELAGFHWTKVHPDGTGEVYVLAIDPAAQGTGLGSVLLAAGLAHLRERGSREVLLYVDGSNTVALHLYERAGFRRHDLDIQWQSPTGELGSGGTQSPATGSVSNT